jgi:hypothetical protein
VAEGTHRCHPHETARKGQHAAEHHASASRRAKTLIAAVLVALAIGSVLITPATNAVQNLPQLDAAKKQVQ